MLNLVWQRIMNMSYAAKEILIFSANISIIILGIGNLTEDSGLIENCFSNKF